MADVLKSKGNEAFKAGEYKKAAKLYRDAIGISPSAVLYLNRAMCFVKLQDWTRAYQDCDQGIGLCSREDKKTLLKLYHRKGVALAALNRFAEARESFQKGLDLDKTNAAILKELQGLPETDKIPIAIKDLDSALKDIVNIIKGTPEPLERESLQKPEVKPAPVLPKVLDHKQLTLLVKECIGNEVPKEPIYTYFVKSVSPAQYKALFSIAGIDAEFLGVFVSAAIYVMKNDSSDQTSKLVFALLETFSQLKRFDLARVFCEESEIKQLIDMLSEAGLMDDDVYQAWGVFHVKTYR